MNKSQLVDAVAEKTALSKKDSEKAVAAVFETISESLKAGEGVQYIGFGTFDVHDRAARNCRNPRNGETVKVAATKVPVFKAGKALKDAVAAGKKAKKAAPKAKK